MLKPLSLFIFLLFPAVSPATETPQNFQVVGTIWEIDDVANAIIVNDQLYYFSASTRIHRGDGLIGSTADLAKGQKVGLFYEVDTRQQPVLTTVWILS